MLAWKKRWSVRTSRWRNFSTCGCGCSGRRKIFRARGRRKRGGNVIGEFAASQILHAGEIDVAGESPVMELIEGITGRTATRMNAAAKLDSDLGLSSLDRVELISALEDRYQVDLSETGFSAARTVGDVERMLRGEARPRN